MNTTPVPLLKTLAVAGWIAGLAALPATGTLLVRYTFDEASSGTTTAVNQDSLGATANGTFFGVATRTGVTPGNNTLGAVNLNPNGDATFEGVGPAGDIAALDQLSTMTVSTWINVQADRTTGVDPYKTLVSDMSFPGSQGWLLYYTANGGNDTQLKLGFQVNTSFRETTTVLSGSNTWLFLAATWDRTTGFVDLYSGTTNTAVSLLQHFTGLTTVMSDNTVPLRVGNDNRDSTANAFMDDVRVYNNVLSPAELETVRFENLIPEPSTTLLVGVGGGVLWYRRGKRRA